MQHFFHSEITNIGEKKLCCFGKEKEKKGKI